MKCASERWKEIFFVNELSFEPLKDSCVYASDIPIYISRNVLKYPEQVKEFMENGYWWWNGGLEESIRPGKSFEFGDQFLVQNYFLPLIEELIKFYDAQDVIPIEFYGNCYNGNKDLYSTMAYLPHTDTYPDADQDLDIDPLNDYAFNLNLTESDKVKTAFYSFNNKRSICDFTKKDHDDFEIVREKHESIEVKDWKKELVDEDYENFRLEYIANIDYNSMILYPSHYWHSCYLKEDWFTDIDRITFTGFFETMFSKVKNIKKLGFG